MLQLGILRLIAAKVLTSVLGDPEMKDAIIGDLRASAKATPNKLDDAGVQVIDTAWDILIPTVAQRIKSKPGQAAPLSSIKL